jgi:transposase
MTTALSKPLLPDGLDLQQLPDDSATLKGMIVELVQILGGQHRHAEHLQFRLDQLLRRLFGRRSERLDPSQLSLFAQEQTPEGTATAGLDKQSKAESQARRRRRGGKHGRQQLPENLPRHVIRCELNTAERNCPCCGQERIGMGEEVSEQLEYVPASFKVNRYVRVKYVCRQCEQRRGRPNAAGGQTATEAAAAPTASQQRDAASAAGNATPTELPKLPSANTDDVGLLQGGVVAAVDVVESPNADAGVERMPETSLLPTAQESAETVALPTPGTARGGESAVEGVGPVAPDGRLAEASPQPERTLAPLGSTLITAPLPPRVIPKCLADPGLLAHVIVNKFVDHLPLYRQEQRFWREGVWLSRRTLCDWLAACAGVLEPLFAVMWQCVFQSRQLHVDDTSANVQGEASKGHLWTYVGDERHPYIVYDFTLGRGGARPRECLQPFKGYLHADGYSGYDQLFGADRREVGCWAHARRYFWESRETAPVHACWMLSCIGQLYGWEAAARYAAEELELSLEDYWDVRRQLRQRQAKPILNRMKEYADKAREQVLPSSPIGTAFTYLSNQWLPLNCYGEYGFLEIDNNVAERALRAIAVGRKNWLFLGSAEGGKTAAILYSLTQTCKRHGVDPWYYLREVLTTLAGLKESERASELPKLLPDVWAARQRQSSRAPPEGSSV